MVICKEEWRRHGTIVPACFAGNMLIATHNYALGAMILPLELAFGWSRAQIAMGPMLPGLAAIAIAPFVGLLIDRIGPRRVALAGVPLYSAAFAALGLAGPSIASWWALYMLVGLASLLIFPTVWTTAINRRFDRNRGLAIAIALTGTGVSAAVLPIVVTLLIGALGWRLTYASVALAAFAVVLPLVYWLFDRSDRRAAFTVVALPVPPAPGALKRAFLSRPYLKLAVAALFFALIAGVLTTNAIPLLLGEGFDTVGAAAIAGLIGIGSITGRALGGVLLDRFDANRVAAGTVATPAISVAILLATQHSEIGAAIACLLLGLAAGAEYDSCAYLTSRHFPLANFGGLFGTIGGLLLFGTSVAPVLANLVYDVLRSYDLVLWALVPFIALGSLLFLSLGPAPTGAEPA